MSTTEKHVKGAALEEVVRRYFLQSGFFVLRGVPFRFGDEDLTDVDLWLYERPTGTARRVQICDIKYKQRPKAVERIFWTKGLAQALDVDGAYVVTTDSRKALRSIARKLEIQLIDGSDIKRIEKGLGPERFERITDETLLHDLQEVDREFRNKNLQEARVDVLSGISEGFGAPSVVRALESFGKLASAAATFHPNSTAARAAGRLAYLAASLVCISLDFVSIEATTWSADDRRSIILNAVRLGALSSESGQQSLKLALALVEKYAPGGRGTATAIRSNLNIDLQRIPAEIVADLAVRLINDDQLFETGRQLETASYDSLLPPFDDLSLAGKSMLGALLDYAGVERERFALAWRRSELLNDVHFEDEKIANDLHDKGV